MAPPLGNRFWEARSSHGRNSIFDHPDQLWDACCEYFEWVEENPLHEGRIVQGKEGHEVIALPKMRAMTVEGMCRFIGISRFTWYEYAKKDGFSNIAKKVSDVLYDQKFTGAAAGLLNANLIARELGLKEQTSNEHVGDPDKPIEHRHELNIAELKSKVNAIISSGD